MTLEYIDIIDGGKTKKIRAMFIGDDSDIILLSNHTILDLKSVLIFGFHPIRASKREEKLFKEWLNKSVRQTLCERVAKLHKKRTPNITYFEQKKRGF